MAGPQATLAALRQEKDPLPARLEAGKAGRAAAGGEGKAVPAREETANGKIQE